MAGTPEWCCIVNDVDSRDDFTAECFNGRMKKNKTTITNYTRSFVLLSAMFSWSIHCDRSCDSLTNVSFRKVSGSQQEENLILFFYRLDFCERRHDSIKTNSEC